MKTRTLVFLALVSLATVGCNNFFHDLIPSDDDRIKSFSVPGQVSVEIGDNDIFVTVSPGTVISAVIPEIQAAQGAAVFPATYEYVSRAFADGRTFGAAMELYASGDMGGKFKDMIRNSIDVFDVHALDLPINFNYPVDFLVVSARGTTRQYTVKVEVDTGEGKFKSFGFDKFFNPEVVRTASGVVNAAAKTVTVNVSYPTENIASYNLMPSFETNGAHVYLDDGTELRSGETLIGFLKPPDSSDLTNPEYGSQTKTLTLKRSGFPDTEWALTVNFSEDPDTSRAVIDFRFKKQFNPLINADYMAEIYNSGDTGTINVTVYYSGARPEELRPSLILPGTATVDDVQQISEYSTHDFYAPLEYVVTSRIYDNVRTYTVTVNLVSASDPLPQINSFSFRTSQNSLLISNSTAMINHAGRLILIEAAYSGGTPPVSLRPTFSASGTVTVNGVEQTSGVTAVDFSNPVGYVVTNPSNPALKREYRVEVKFVNSLSSVAQIETFSFYMEDNPGLVEDVDATVDQMTGEITAALLFDTPGGNRTLVPRWSAQGIVESGGVAQTSGESGRQFYTPQTYGVVSVDSGFRKDYTVTVTELNSRIYVKYNATGRNDGTNWENAYRTLHDANSARSNSVPTEIWIAKGTYTEENYTYLDLRSGDVYFIGGFIGNETSKNARSDPANNKPTIINEGSSRLFNAFQSGAVRSFEDIVITGGNFDAWGAQINIYITVGGTVIFKGVDFKDAYAGGNGNNPNLIGGGSIVIYSSATDVIMEDCSFTNIRTGQRGGAVFFFNSPSVSISNCRFSNTESGLEGGAIYFSNCSNVTVTNCVFDNTSARNNIGNAITFDNCTNINAEESGNTFTNVQAPRFSTQ